MKQSAADRGLFRRAVQLYKKGDRATAYQYMRRVLLDDPAYVPGWLWMSTLVDDIGQQRECLQRALSIDPACEPAIRGLEMLKLQERVNAIPRIKEVGREESSSTETQRQARKLGEYLIERGLITHKQLEEALEEQRMFWKKFQGVREPLGNILIKSGMLTPQALATALVTQQQDKLHGGSKPSPEYLGEYLVAKGVITSQQLQTVLTEQLRLQQRGKSMLIGELLIHGGHVTRELLEQVLAEQREVLFSRFGFED